MDWWIETQSRFRKMLRCGSLQIIFGVCVICGLIFVFQDTQWLRFQTASHSAQSNLRVDNLPDQSSLLSKVDTVIDEQETDEGEEVGNMVPEAPRSHDGPYDEYVQGRRYIIYHPSGGFSNQRMELEYAVEIGKLLNRTVYVPMCGRHTNGWVNYNALVEGPDLFPMDRILDFPFIESYSPRVHLAPLNMTVSRFVGRFQKKWGPESVLIISGMDEFYGREQVLRWRQYKQPLIFFRGPGFFHPWFPQTTLSGLRLKFRFTKYLRDSAIKVTNAFFGEKFYSMHIRMGDYAYRRTGDASTFVNKAREYNWNLKEHKTYIATEPHRDMKYFAPLDRMMDPVYSTDLPKDLVMNFKRAFPKGKIRDDMLGILEQLIAAQSKSFIGTYFSTFSAYIIFMRQNKAVLFPELVDLDTTGDASAGEATAGDDIGGENGTAQVEA